MKTKPTKLKPFKHVYRAPMVKELNHEQTRHAKQQKLDMLNDLVKTLSNQLNVDHEYLIATTKRRNKTRIELQAMRP